MRKIQSRQNPLFRRLRSLTAERGPVARESVWVEGYRLCLEALAADVAVEILVISENASEERRAATIAAAPPDVETVILPEEMFQQIAVTMQSQGIACVIPRPRPSLLPSDARGCRYLVLENVQDPGNVGTMVRTADAMGFDGVILLPGTADPFGAKALRSAMGAAFRIPSYSARDMVEAAGWLHRQNCTIYAAHLAGQPLPTSGLRPPGAIVIGNEGAGLTVRTVQLCDHLVRIPMSGQAESLNAASAAAILCYSMGTFDDAASDDVPSDDAMKEGVTCTSS